MLSCHLGLVATTSPRFECLLDQSLQAVTFHPESPAGRWWARDGVKPGPFVFSDPHQGQGGFGGSTAEFAGVWCLMRAAGRADYQMTNEEALLMWNDYRSLFPTKKPSGVDLVAQALGGLCEFGFEDKVARTYLWDFEDFDFLIFRTGKKVKTHEHLDGLDLGDVSALGQIYGDFVQGLVEKDSAKVMAAVSAYRDDLDARGWLARATKVLIAELQAADIAIKGCGALGADTCAAFGPRDAVDGLVKRCLERGLVCIARSGDLSEGLAISR